MFALDDAYFVGSFVGDFKKFVENFVVALINSLEEFLYQTGDEELWLQSLFWTR